MIVQELNFALSVKGTCVRAAHRSPLAELCKVHLWGRGGFVQLSTNLHSIKRAGGFSFLAHLDNIQTQASVIQNLRSGTFLREG